MRPSGPLSSLSAQISRQAGFWTNRARAECKSFSAPCTRISTEYNPLDPKLILGLFPAANPPSNDSAASAACYSVLASTNAGRL